MSRQTLDETQAICATIEPGDHGPGVKADAGKPDLIMFPFSALRSTESKFTHQAIFELVQGERFAEAWDLLIYYEYCTIETVTAVLEFGATKYSPNNWQKVRPGIRYASGALRHLLAIARGEEFDRDSGLPHFAHIGCNLIFCIWMHRQGINLWSDAK